MVRSDEPFYLGVMDGMGELSRGGVVLYGTHS